MRSFRKCDGLRNAAEVQCDAAEMRWARLPTMPPQQNNGVASAPICHSTLYAEILKRYHTVSRSKRLEVAK